MPTVLSPISSRSSATPGSTLTTSMASATNEEIVSLPSATRSAGEASRLRRRNAMWFDRSELTANNFVPSISTSSLPVSNLNHSRIDSAASNPTVVVSSLSTLTNESPYTSGSNLRRMDSGQRQVKPEPQSFTLFCGGIEDSSCDTIGGPIGCSAPFKPSLLPILDDEDIPGPCIPTISNCSEPQTNGCGALLHIRAIPKNRMGVYTARSLPCTRDMEDVLVPLDDWYFADLIDDGSVNGSGSVQLVKSVCGCERIGIGCAMCGNLLGTRFKPCKSATASSSSGSERPRAPYNGIDGCEYWRGSTTLKKDNRSDAKNYVYTFFSTAVTASPPYTFPSNNSHTLSHTRQSTGAAASYYSQRTPIPPSPYAQRTPGPPSPSIPDSSPQVFFVDNSISESTSNLFPLTRDETEVAETTLQDDVSLMNDWTMPSPATLEFVPPRLDEIRSRDTEQGWGFGVSSQANGAWQGDTVERGRRDVRSRTVSLNQLDVEDAEDKVWEGRSGYVGFSR